MHLDVLCEYYRKPLFGCTTLGVSASTQTIIPYQTAAYRDRDISSEGQDIPLCTVRNLPYMIEHTIEYARSAFVDMFTDQMQDAKAYLSNPELYVARLRSNETTAMELAQQLITNLRTERPRTFDDCILWARKLSEETFMNRINQLLFSFPPGSTDKHGLPFWFGSKREPHPIPFDATDEQHLMFVGSAAFIRAQTYSTAVDHKLDLAHVAAVAATFVPTTAFSLQGDAAAPSPASATLTPTELGQRRSRECGKSAFHFTPEILTIERF
jgi:ubiquitin-activating enzyme E1